MQSMIGRDAVLLLINHRIGACRNDLRLGNCNTTALNAQIAVLEDLKYQMDFIVPMQLDTRTLIVVEERRPGRQEPAPALSSDAPLTLLRA